MIMDVDRASARLFMGVLFVGVYSAHFHCIFLCVNIFICDGRIVDKFYDIAFPLLQWHSFHSIVLRNTIAAINFTNEPYEIKMFVAIDLTAIPMDAIVKEILLLLESGNVVLVNSQNNRISLLQFCEKYITNQCTKSYFTNSKQGSRFGDFKAHFWLFYWVFLKG